MKRGFFLACVVLFGMIFTSNAVAQSSGELVDSAKSLLFAQDSSAMLLLDLAYDVAENDVDKAVAVKYKGVWNYYRRLNNEAIEFYKEALDILDNASPTSEIEKANVFNNIGLIMEDTGEIDSALNCYLQTIKMRESENDTIGLLRLSYPNSIGLLMTAGNYPKALELSLEMLDVADLSNELSYAANAYDFAGSIFEIQENYSDSRASYEAALSLRQQIGDSSSYSRSYNNLGIVFYREQAYDSALNYSLKAYDLQTKYNDYRGILSTYNNLGLIYQAMDSLELSLEQYLNSYEMGKQLPGNKSTLIASINITAIALEIDNLVLAEKHALESYKVAKATVQGSLLRDAAQNMALVRAKQARFDEAYVYMKETYDLQDALFDEEITRKLTENQLKFEYEKVMQQDSIRNAEEMHESRLSYEEKLRKQQVRLVVAVFTFIMIILVFIIVVMRNRSNQREQKAKLEKKSKEIETSLLRAQMNPHFIFNSMNSIQNFISKNDSLQAERYLAKFAKLIRLILDNSAKAFVPMEDELSLIENYLEIESLRLDGKLSYEIILDDKLDVEEICIPSMLIQPYIENSILHGIVPKDGKGKVVIEFTAINDNEVKVLISDDGIGRKASQERKQNYNPLHKSVGMRITKDRLELLSKHEDADALVDIDNLYKDGNLSGTRVVILLPIKTVE